MKIKLLFIIISILLCVSSEASRLKATEFFEDGKTWISETYFPLEIADGDFSRVFRTETKVIGDTVLCERNAKILRTRRLNQPIEYDDHYSFTSYVYEDNGAIYFYSKPVDSFFELINFNVSRGDSLFTDYASRPIEPKNFSLQVIDDFTIDISGENRRTLRLAMDPQSKRRDTYWIEGIGSVNDTYISVFPTTSNGEKTNLIKCYKGDTVYFTRDELGKIIPEAAIPLNYFKVGEEAYLVYPEGLQHLDSYSYRFISNPLDINSGEGEVAFCGNPGFVNCTDRNWGADFSVPDEIEFQTRHYSVTQIEGIATDIIHNLTIPATVRRLCDSSVVTPELETLSLPASLQTIGYSIFADSRKLKTIEIAAVNPPTLCNDEGETVDIAARQSNSGDYKLPFADYNADCTLVVPEGSAEKYRQDPVFGRFAKIVEKSGLSGADSTEADDFSVATVSEGLVVSCAAQTAVWIYGVDGTLRESRTLQSGATDISLPQGFYVVRTMQRALKVAVR